MSAKCTVCGGQPKPEGAAFFRPDCMVSPSFAEAQRLASAAYCSPECVVASGGRVTADSYAEKP